jgi:hypothetical protein
MNHEERVAYNKAYYIKNREKILASQVKNREKILAYQAEYRKTHAKELQLKNWENSYWRSQVRRDKRFVDK